MTVLGKTSWRACLTLALAGIAGLAGPAVAAERALPLLVTAPDHPLPETAPGGTVILRGPRASSAANQSSAGSSANAAPQRPAPLTAWARDYDPRADRGASHSFDTTGFDGNFDRSGLHP